MRRILVVAILVGASVAGGAGSGAAQSLGAFRWQLQPYCNVLTVTVQQNGAQYQIDGTDDQCGATRRAAIVGLAFPNPDGSIGFGLTAVTTPGGAPVHIDARINLASLSGPWQDSAGNAGTLVFTPGGSTGGSLRPVPAGGIAPGSITAAHLAPGSVGAAQLAGGSVNTVHLAPGAVAGATAALGACAAGQYLRGIQANGALLCEPFAVRPLTTLVNAAAFPEVTGWGISVAIGGDGLPVVSHTGTTGLLVTHCSNAACTQSVTNPIAPAPGDYEVQAMTIGASGFPVIAVGSAGGVSNAFWVVRCTNALCSSSQLQPVDAAPANVGAPSIARGADGVPVIARVAFAGGLRVIHCGNAACTAPTALTVDAPGNEVGFMPSLRIGSDGFPIIAHFDRTAGALRVTHCTTVTCSTSESTTVDAPGDTVGLNASLAIGSDGRAVISHRSGSDSTVRVTHCANVACTSATSRAVGGPAGLPSLPTEGSTSLAIGTDGFPVISSLDATRSVLRVSHCTSVDCATATTAIIDEAGSPAGRYSALVIGTDGLPVVGHFNDTSRGVNVTKCASRQCR